MIEDAKDAAGKAAAELIENNMRVGLGSGSTAAHFIRHLAERCRDGLKISAIASSKESEELAKKFGIPLDDAQSIRQLDITVDGADEIDPKKQMIKGGGGAFLREKILASISKEMIVIIDETKQVKQLGNHPLPLEIAPFCSAAVIHRLEQIGHKGKLRKLNKKVFITDNGNYIWDLECTEPIESPKFIDLELQAITGVIETGLFYGLAGRVIIGCEDGHVEIK